MTEKKSDKPKNTSPIFKYANKIGKLNPVKVK